MNEGINNILEDELLEAHGMFENIIREMKENDVKYCYDEITTMEESSYNIANNAISKMRETQKNYLLLKNNYKDFFSGEKKIIVKYIMLYVVSIIIIKVFAKTVPADKLNEMWYALLGMTLGTVNAGIINKSINEYRNSNKEYRDVMSQLDELKIKYDDNFEVARKEVSYIFSLNRNLQDEVPEEKVFIKQ